MRGAGGQVEGGGVSSGEAVPVRPSPCLGTSNKMAPPPAEILALLFFVFGSESSQAGRGLQLFECRCPQACSVAAQRQRNLTAPASTARKSLLKHEDESEKIDIGLFSL